MGRDILQSSVGSRAVDTAGTPGVAYFMTGREGTVPQRGQAAGPPGTQPSTCTEQWERLVYPVETGKTPLSSQRLPGGKAPIAPRCPSWPPGTRHPITAHRNLGQAGDWITSTGVCPRPHHGTGETRTFPLWAPKPPGSPCPGHRCLPGRQQGNPAQGADSLLGVTQLVSGRPGLDPASHSPELCSQGKGC